MRRLLIVVLALVLPLKAVAAGVVPIIGTPEHAHVAVHAAVQASADHEHDDCGAHAAKVHSAADTLHEHACPHLGMASVAPQLATFETEHFAPRAPSETVAHFVSVVLDVPSPPPTRRA
ncbi:MAG: hypothetical protein OHK0044_31520 [Burkholderiaceae bacterium]